MYCLIISFIFISPDLIKIMRIQALWTGCILPKKIYKPAKFQERRMRVWPWVSREPRLLQLQLQGPVYRNLRPEHQLRGQEPPAHLQLRGGVQGRPPRGLRQTGRHWRPPVAQEIPGEERDRDWSGVQRLQGRGRGYWGQDRGGIEIRRRLICCGSLGCREVKTVLRVTVYRGRSRI